MPKIKGDIASYSTRTGRLEALIQALGGPTEAARLTGKTRSTIDNWRKKGSAELADLAILAGEAGISLDWLEYGGPVAERGQQGQEAAPRISGASQQGKLVGLAGHPLLSPEWVKETFGLSVDQVRLVELADNAMAPMLKRGAVVLVDARPEGPHGDFVVVEGPRLVARRHYVMPDGMVQLTADADPNWRLADRPERMPRLYSILWHAQTV